MAKRRPDLAAINLRDAPAVVQSTRDDGKEAQTLRLPPEYWHRARVLAAMRHTTMQALVRAGLDEVFKRVTAQERAAIGM